MAKIILLNKPFHVLCQFTDSQNRSTLADYVDTPNMYPAGRLDFDSEGLVLLTDDGQLQQRIASPRQKMPKTYWVQVEGEITCEALESLSNGVQLNDGPTRPAIARHLDNPDIWHRDPPVRYRPTVPTSWLELTLSEGRNRQVRRMTAAVGFPTLRLVRYQVGSWSIDALDPGESRKETVHLPGKRKSGNTGKPKPKSKKRAKTGRRP